MEAFLRRDEDPEYVQELARLTEEVRQRIFSQDDNQLINACIKMVMVVGTVQSSWLRLAVLADVSAERLVEIFADSVAGFGNISEDVSLLAKLLLEARMFRYRSSRMASLFVEAFRYERRNPHAEEDRLVAFLYETRPGIR